MCHPDPNASSRSNNAGRRPSLVPMNPVANNRNPASDVEEFSHIRQASSLTQTEITKNLNLRGLKPSGFWEDDVELLQKAFIKEHKQREKARADSLLKEEESLLNEQKQKALERAQNLSMYEEQNALRRQPGVKRWLDLVAQNKCNPSAVFRMRPVVIRCIVKGIPPVSCLRSLQLSRNRLTDRVGRHIAQMLRVNKSLTNLDLSVNDLGPFSAAQLGHALRENCTLKTLDLSSNPLTVGNNGRDLVGVKVRTAPCEPLEMGCIVVGRVGFP